MESDKLSAIHLTVVEGEAAEAAECDTFMPPVDETRFRLWSAGLPQRQGATRYAFLCYTRAGQQDVSQLPPAVAGRHEEMQVVRWASALTWLLVLLVQPACAACLPAAGKARLLRLPLLLAVAFLWLA
jgi:hypothetical protein